MPLLKYSLSYKQLKLAPIPTHWNGRGLPVVSFRELCHWNCTFSVGGGWFKTQRIKEMTRLSL